MSFKIERLIRGRFEEHSGAIIPFFITMKQQQFVESSCSRGLDGYSACRITAASPVQLSPMWDVCCMSYPVFKHYYYQIKPKCTKDIFKK